MDNKLIECLKRIDYPSLPEKLKDGVFWTKAIVLVNKEINPVYALAKRGENGEAIVFKTFGLFRVVTIDEIYPYEVDYKIIQMVNETKLPNFQEWKAKLKKEYPDFKQNQLTGKNYEQAQEIFANYLKQKENGN